MESAGKTAANTTNINIPQNKSVVNGKFFREGSLTQEPIDGEGRFSRDLGLRGERSNMPTSASEWSAFNRSFANKTIDIAPDKTKIIAVFTDRYAYIVESDGYMCGYAEEKIDLDNKDRIRKIGDIYGSHNRQGENTDSMAEAYGSVERQHNRGHADAGEAGPTGYAGTLPDGQQDSDRTGNYEEGLGDNEEFPPGSIVFDGTNAYQIGEDGIHLPIDIDDSGEIFSDTVGRFSREVTDKDILHFLENQETITTYKTMQLVDGKLYPPIASRINGQFEDASTIGKWEEATEHPELIKGNNKFKLDKGKGQGSIEATTGGNISPRNGN